jgi:serine/threonine-protein kinase
MSPEQSRGEPADHRSDLFSLGSVLYAMCTGRPPFRANSALAVLRRVSDEQPRPIRELNPAIPEELVTVIEKLHAKDPAQRYQTAADVSAALGQLLADMQKPVRRKTTPLPLPKALPRHRKGNPAHVAGIALVAALVIGGLAGSAKLGDWFFHPSPVQPSGDGEDALAPAAGASAESGAAAAAAASAVCNADSEEPGDRPFPPVGPVEFEIPFGPLVRLGKLDKETGDFSITVTFGDRSGDTVVGSGKVETRTFDLKDFTAIDIRAPFVVDLKQGKEFKVSVTADDNLFDYFQVDKEGNKLLLGFKKKSVSLHLKRDDALKASITLPVLEDLHTNSAARVQAGPFTVDGPFRLRTNGASKFEGSVKAGTLTVDANGASKIELAGSAEGLRIKANGASKLEMSDFTASGDGIIIDANGASHVQVKGTVKGGVIKASGASHLDLSDLKLAIADVTLDGASHATIRVTEKLNYNVSGVSHLTYYGDPKIGNSNKSGHSHVSREN